MVNIDGAAEAPAEESPPEVEYVAEEGCFLKPRAKVRRRNGNGRFA